MVVYNKKSKGKLFFYGLFLSKKTIAPIVALSLVLILTVLSVTVFKDWFFDFQMNIIAGGEKNDLEQNKNVYIDEIIGNELYFRNEYMNITIEKIVVNNNSCVLDKSYSSGLHLANIDSCLESSIHPTMQVDIFTNKGIFSKTLLVNTIPYSSCTIGSVTLSHGKSYTFYNSSNVSFGKTCTFVLRDCNNGTFTGDSSYQYSSCYVEDQDITPEPFAFTNRNNVQLSTLIESEIVTPIGYDGPLSIGITGDGNPQIRINSGEWITSGQMNPLDTLQIKLNSSSYVLNLSTATLTMGDYSISWNVTTKDILNCSTLPLAGGMWVSVPGNSDLGTEDFCVMKYEAKFYSLTGKTQDTYKGWRYNNALGNLNITSIPYSEPIVYVNQLQAKNACESLGEGYHLITNAEWTTIARNAELINENWDTEVVGFGSMMGGHSDSSPGYSLAADLNDNDGYYNTDNSVGSTQRRTLKLSNDEMIWDLSGNLFEWNNDTCFQGSPWYSGGLTEWTSANINGLEKILAGPLGNYDSSNGMGYYYGCTYQGNAFARSCYWGYGSVNGPFTLYLGFSDDTSGFYLGFRCAYTHDNERILPEIVPDSMPDAFTFTNLTRVSVNTLVESEVVLTTGFDGPINVAVAGDGNPQLRINGGAWVSSGQINSADTLQIRMTSSSSFLTLSTVSLTIGDYSTSWSVTTKEVLNCAALSGGSWIEVAANAALGTEKFCVMKYEAKFTTTTGKTQDSTYKVWKYSDATGDMSIRSNPTPEPIGYITQAQARTACQSLGEGYKLITRAEWVTVAREAEANSYNWKSSAMYKGHTDFSPNSALPVASTSNEYTETGNSAFSGANQRRTLKLANGQLIWDFSGNVREWNNDTYPNQNSSLGQSSSGYYEWTVVPSSYNHLKPLNTAYTSSNGIGKTYAAVGNAYPSGGTHAFISGGFWMYSTESGAFTLDLFNGPTVLEASIGFRCTYS